MASSPAIQTDEHDLPSFVRPEVGAIADDLTLVHDLLAGTRRMWAQSNQASYIRKWADESPSVYDIRRQGETLFEGLGRTLSAATGMIFAKPPRVTWNESETAMQDQWPNLDGAGTAGPVLIKRFAEASIRDGLGLILVDHPSPPIDPATKQPITITGANETLLGLRPTWALYGRGQIINWRTATLNNQRVPTLVVLHEKADVVAGQFGLTSEHRYRVLRLVLTPDGWQATWTLYRLTGDDATDAGNFTVVDSGVFRNKANLVASTLPVSIAYTGRTDAPFCATIPLMGVAWANLAHWQVSTDLRFYRSLAAFPQPTVIGELAPDAQTGGKGVLRMGPMVGVQIAQGGEFKWTELSGTSMEQLEHGITEKLKQMSQLGMSFLLADTRAAETAEAKALDATAENSTLATAAQGIEDAVNAALEIHAWYLGIEKAGAPTVTLSRDYAATVLDAPTMLAYVQAADTIGFPVRQLLEAWQQGGRVPADADLDAMEQEMRDHITPPLDPSLDPAMFEADRQKAAQRLAATAAASATRQAA